MSRGRPKQAPSSLTPLEEVVHSMLTGDPYEEHTLDYISKVFKISKERIRQIELAALRKIKKRLTLENSESHAMMEFRYNRFVKILY